MPVNLFSRAFLFLYLFLFFKIKQIFYTVDFKLKK